MSHLATDLAYKFGVLFWPDLLSLGGLGSLLRSSAWKFGLCFLPKAFSAFCPLVSVYSAVAALAIEFSLCLPVLLGLGVRCLRRGYIWLGCAYLIERLRTGCVWDELCILTSALHKCPDLFHRRLPFACHGQFVLHLNGPRSLANRNVSVMSRLVPKCLFRYLFEFVEEVIKGLS